MKGDVAREQVESRCMLHLPTAPHGRTRGIPVAQGGGAGTLMPRVGARGGETPAHGARVMPRTGPAHTCGDGSEQVHVAPTHGPPWPHPGRPRGPEGPPRYTESAGGVWGGRNARPRCSGHAPFGPAHRHGNGHSWGIMVRNPPPRPPGGGGQAQGERGGGGGGGGAHSATRGRAHRPGC